MSKGCLFLNLLSLVPTLFLNVVLSWRGFYRFPSVTA